MDEQEQKVIAYKSADRKNKKNKQIQQSHFIHLSDIIEFVDGI